MLKKIFKYGEISLSKKYRQDMMKNPKIRNLFWETTLSCNAKCKHCGSNAENKVYDNELTSQEIKGVFKQVSERYDAKEILLNITGGEPLIRKDLFEVMEYAVDLGFKWGMTTNGILLNEDNIQKCKKADMCTISISIDGLEKTHDEFRGVEGSYNTIINNIKNLKQADFLSVIQVTTVVNKQNIDELEELYNIMLDLKIDSWRIVNMDPIGRANNNSNLLLDENDMKILLNFITKKGKSKNMVVTYGCSHFVGFDYEKEVRSHYFLCMTGIDVASILYNGDIFVCPNVERRPEFIQGNVRKDNFCDIWENKYEVFRNVDRTKCDKCSKCEHYEFCLGDSFHTFDFDKKEPKICLGGLKK